MEDRTVRPQNHKPLSRSISRQIERSCRRNSIAQRPDRFVWRGLWQVAVPVGLIYETPHPHPNTWRRDAPPDPSRSKGRWGEATRASVAAGPLTKAGTVKTDRSSLVGSKAKAAVICLACLPSAISFLCA